MTRHRDLVRALQRAFEAGDPAAIEALLDPAITLVLDAGHPAAPSAPGGPAASSAVPPGIAAEATAHGIEDTSALLLRLFAGPTAGAPALTFVEHSVNGCAGLVAREGDRAIAVIAVDTTTAHTATEPAGAITALWVVASPAKIRHWNTP